MKFLNKIQLFALLFLGTATFADDIWFVSPTHGQNINGKFTIQIQPPYQATTVQVWIEEDRGWDKVVWRGVLNAANNYTIAVDASKFKPGKYEVQAEYYIGREDYDGDVDIWVGGQGGQVSPDGEYFPQQ